MPAKVIVVGGGLSGLSAAHTLYERGANVVLLDKNGFMGGNSTKATSGINGAGTISQQDLGIKDSAKIFFDDTKKSARDLARDDLIKVLTGRSGDAISWLMDRFNLDLSKVSRLGGHSQPRTHRGGAQFPGMVITYAQMEKLEELAEADPERVKIIKKAKVTGLQKDAQGGVIGVEYEHQGQKYTEDGPVVLATGGYAADFDKTGLLHKYRPELTHLPTTNGEHSTGDGHKMVLDIGGKGIDLEKVQVHPTGLVDPKDPDAKVKFLAAEALRGVGGLLLDGEGDRFCDELGHRDYVTGRIWDNNKYPVRLILNKDSIKEINWHVHHYVGRGLMKKFNSGYEVAKEMGISADKLKKTFDDYRKVASGAEKDKWGKKFYHNPEFTMDSEYAVAIMTPVLHYTMGGVEIDPEGRILDTAGQAIPGLFACGELAGGVHGANRLGGSSLLGCVVFGRVAGDTASSYLLNGMTTGKIAGAARLNQIANHLETKIRIDPSSSKAVLEFSWAGEGSSAAAPQQQQQQQIASTSASSQQQQQPAKESSEPVKKEYTLEDVKAHNAKDDCWVVVNGEVLDVTKFLPDHPGGEKAILLFAGRDATEEFNMLHDPKVVKKYAPECIIGTLKE